MTNTYNPADIRTKDKALVRHTLHPQHHNPRLMSVPVYHRLAQPPQPSPTNKLNTRRTAMTYMYRPTD